MLDADYRAALREGGSLLFEIGYDQGDALRSLATDRALACRIFKDYGGNDRVAWVN
jgi:methylase of polypeptide subunit release factors